MRGMPRSKTVASTGTSPGKGSADFVKRESPGADNPKADTPKIDERYASFRLKIKPSKIHRWGVFALEDIPARRKVMEYTGERISRRETKRRSEEQGRMICDPNVEAEIRGQRIVYLTRRAIRKGEELTIDYHFAKDIERIPCSCGSELCRGTINLK